MSTPFGGAHAATRTRTDVRAYRAAVTASALPPAARALALSLAVSADADGRVRRIPTWAALRPVVDGVPLSNRAARAALHLLQRGGWLRLVHRTTRDGRRCRPGAQLTIPATRRARTAEHR